MDFNINSNYYNKINQNYNSVKQNAARSISTESSLFDSKNNNTAETLPDVQLDYNDFFQQLQAFFNSFISSLFSMGGINLSANNNVSTPNSTQAQSSNPFAASGSVADNSENTTGSTKGNVALPPSNGADDVNDSDNVSDTSSTNKSQTNNNQNQVATPKSSVSDDNSYEHFQQFVDSYNSISKFSSANNSEDYLNLVKDLKNALKSIKDESADFSDWDVGNLPDFDVNSDEEFFKIRDEYMGKIKQFYNSLAGSEVNSDDYLKALAQLNTYVNAFEALVTKYIDFRGLDSSNKADNNVNNQEVRSKASSDIYSAAAGLSGDFDVNDSKDMKYVDKLRDAFERFFSTFDEKQLDAFDLTDFSHTSTINSKNSQKQEKNTYYLGDIEINSSDDFEKFVRSVLGFTHSDFYIYNQDKSDSSLKHLYGVYQMLCEAQDKYNAFKAKDDSNYFTDYEKSRRDQYFSDITRNTDLIADSTAHTPGNSWYDARIKELNDSLDKLLDMNFGDYQQYYKKPAILPNIQSEQDYYDLKNDAMKAIDAIVESMKTMDAKNEEYLKATAELKEAVEWFNSINDGFDKYLDGLNDYRDLENISKINGSEFVDNMSAEELENLINSVLQAGDRIYSDYSKSELNSLIQKSNDFSIGYYGTDIILGVGQIEVNSEDQFVDTAKNLLGTLSIFASSAIKDRAEYDKDFYGTLRMLKEAYDDYQNIKELPSSINNYRYLYDPHIEYNPEDPNLNVYYFDNRVHPDRWSDLEDLSIKSDDDYYNKEFSLMVYQAQNQKVIKDLETRLAKADGDYELKLKKDLSNAKAIARQLVSIGDKLTSSFKTSSMSKSDNANYFNQIMQVANALEKEGASIFDYGFDGVNTAFYEEYQHSFLMGARNANSEEQGAWDAIHNEMLPKLAKDKSKFSASTQKLINNLLQSKYSNSRPEDNIVGLPPQPPKPQIPHPDDSVKVPEVDSVELTPVEFEFKETEIVETEDEGISSTLDFIEEL